MAFWRPGEPESREESRREIARRQGLLPDGANKKKPHLLKKKMGLSQTIGGYCSGRLEHGSGTDATGAHANMHAITTGGGHSHTLQIRQPTPSVLIVGMTYIVAGGRAFSTNCTFF